MTREKLKDVLEIIGFAAIVASLVFVGIKTRNSARQAALTTQAFDDRERFCGGFPIVKLQR